MPEPKLRIIFAGSGEFGLPTMNALARSGHEIVQVVTQPDKPAGRGRSLAPTPIGSRAIELQLPLVRTTDIGAETLAAADLMIVIAFGQKIPPSHVHHPRLGSVNLHASRLPKYRGAAPINWAILGGERVTGNSVIRLADRMDAGEILGQSSVEIGSVETAGELHDRLAIDGVDLVLKVVSQIASGSAIETPQDESQATLAPKLSRKSAIVDFNLPAERVARTIRGLYPWPGCRVRMIDGEGTEITRLRLVRAGACAGEGNRWEPGEITSSGDVQCGDQAINILQVQPDGGIPMAMAEFRRGHRWQAGLRLAAIE